MKKKLAIISLLLACVFAFGACGKTNDSESSSTGEEGGVVTEVKDYEGGIHEYSAQSTSEYLIKNRSSEYKILLPEDASAEIVTSAEDMQNLILEATGARLEMIEDSSAVSSSQKVISVGNTKMAAESNVRPTEDLGDSGYVIKTVGKNVFIVGNLDFALSFGIYGFLEAQFKFECFSDTYYYIEKKDSVALLNLAVKEVPDLGKVQIGSGFTGGNAKRRMKLLDREEYVLGYQTVHSALRYIPYEVYNDEANAPETYHPNWFASGANQLCYMARGDETERTALVNEVANIFITYLKEDRTKSYFTFGQSDEYTWCGCDYCDAEFSKYSSNAAVVIKFLNDVTQVIDIWMEGEGSAYAREYLIIFIAYQKTLAAPKLVDDSVICDEHVAVMFCPYQLDLQNSLYAEVNSSYLKMFDEWRSVASNFSYFGYFYVGKSFLHFYDCFEAMKEILLYLAESNTKVFFTETPPNHKGSAYHAMRSYVLAKLAWNVNLDIDELIDNFCEKYYMEGAEIMREIFYQELALAKVNKPALSMQNFFNNGNLSDKKYWPKNLVIDWYNLTNEALNKIVYLKKTDPALYDIIYDNITLERLSFEYILVTLYEKELAADFVYTLKVQAIQDASRNGVLMIGLNNPISTVFDTWEV